MRRMSRVWKFDVDEEVQINEITELDDVDEDESEIQDSSSSRADYVSRRTPQLVHQPSQLSILRQCTSYPSRLLSSDSELPFAQP